MRRVIPFIVAGLLFLAAADPALAQQRLFAFTTEEVVEVDTQLATLGRVIHRVRLGGNANSNAVPGVPVAGGSLLAWTANGKVVLYDTRTRSVQAHAVPDFIAGQVLGTDRGSFQLSVLGSSRASGNALILTADLRTGAVRLLDLGTGSSALGLPGASAYARDAGLLFLAQQRLPAGDNEPSHFLDVTVLRLSDGAVVRQFAIEQAGASLIDVNPAGTRLLVRGGGSAVLAVDVVSAAPMASNAVLVFRTLRFDEHRGRLLGVTQDGQGPRLEAFAAETLQSIGAVRLPAMQPPGGAIVALDVSGQSATIFAAQVQAVSTGYSHEACVQGQLVALNVDTGAPRGVGDLTPILVRDRCAIGLARVTEPDAPGAPSATVAGQAVTFDWPAVAAASYELEAGSAPSLADISRFTVTENHFAIGGVPSGVYYVRVRGVNVIGKGPASQDVRVVVP